MIVKSSFIKEQEVQASVATKHHSITIVGKQKNSSWFKRRFPYFQNSNSFFKRSTHIFAAKLKGSMGLISVKRLLVLGCSLFIIFFYNSSFAQNLPEKEESKFQPGDLLMEHILDAHEFHFLDIGKTHVSLPLPVIIYSPQRGFTAFMSSEFHHGTEAHNGYRLIDEPYFKSLEQKGLDAKKLGLGIGKIIAVNENDEYEQGVKIYDLSITRNVAQMLIAMILLVWILTSVAKKYRIKGHMVAPSGFQNAIEPVITFIRDEVGKSNLGNRYEKYMPYLLTVFFFILINNLIGLIPGTANVTGNIAFTVVLGVISFIVIMFNTNGHYWKHIFNPPAPGFLKPILFIVELLGVFTKPIALIVRLFANMIAGHMIITCLVLLIFIFGALNTAAGYGFSPVSLAFAIFIYLIEVLVAFIQAFIFTNLTAVFVSQAFEEPHKDAHGHDDNAVYI